jgi:hypothetical protein
MDKVDPRDPQTWIPRELYAAYVGPGSDALLTHYDKAKANKNPLTMSFSLLALLALPAWLGLHRQWAMWATFTGLIGVLPFLEHAIGFEFPAGGFAGIGVAMALMARGLLLTNANSQYSKLKRQGLDASAIKNALEGRARANVPFAIAGGVGAVMVIMGLAQLASILSGQPFP